MFVIFYPAWADMNKVNNESSNIRVLLFEFGSFVLEC